MRLVAIIGAMPPPTHGLASINARMVELLSDRRPTVFNTAGGSRHRLGRLESLFSRRLGIIPALWRWLNAGGPNPKSVYLGVSGGMGQLVDAIYVKLALRAGARVFVHHHSFAYLNRRKLYAQFFMRMARDANHIVLCDRMQSLLCKRFDLNSRKVRVLSNSALINEDSAKLLASPAMRRRVGFLSNITLEKGILEFFCLYDELRARLPVRWVIAGPVDSAIRGRFQQELNSRPEIEYLGPVYGAQKAQFLSELSVLVFPTLYEHEAEPLVVLEAQREGAEVIAYDRGCIRDIVGNPLNVVQSREQMCERLMHLLVGGLPSNPRHSFQRLMLQSASSRNELIEEITG